MISKNFTFLIIIVLTVFALWANLPSLEKIPNNLNILGKSINISFLKSSNITNKFPLKLGLDLQGGVELVLKTDMAEIDSSERDIALESARGVIERRVNFYGVSEAVVRTSKVADERRILVELPGVNDLDQAVALVGRTAQLEFREFDASPSAKPPEATISAFFDFSDYKPTGLTGADLKKADVVFGASGQAGSGGPQISLEFSGDGVDKFAQVTRRNISKPLAIFLDDQPLTWPPPTVNQEIIDGKAVLTGSFTPEEAKNLAIQLNAGALPVPIEILSQRQIAPTLGQEFVDKSIIAGIIGFIAVMFYMVSFYGRMGVVANFALLIYAILVLAIFRTGLFILPQVTLTLAGIAGFILSVGMAVDANILTFERIKEELRAGRTGKSALEHGFQRSWTSIRDSNISSLITAAILYILGTSVVRGFALTLAIGVLVSMFSAIVITRTLLGRMARFKK